MTDSTNAIENPTPEQSAAQKEEGYYRRQFEKAQRELDRLRAEHEEQVNSLRSEAERSQSEHQGALTEAGRLRSEITKRDLCAREGVPQSLAKYVTGEDEESLLASIRQVKEDFPEQAPEDRGVGIATRPGKQPLGIDPDALSPMQKIAHGLSQ